MIRVVKVGGSLLDVEGAPLLVADYLAAQPPACNVLVIGGGGLVEAVRQGCAQGEVDDEAAHWTAISAMSLTAAFFGQFTPGATLVESLEEVRDRSLQPGAMLVFDCARFLRDVEPTLPGYALPASWDTTSDAIAGRLAQALGAAELVLLKSALPPADATLASASAAGYVDAALPRLELAMPIRAVNLRDAAWPEQRLNP